MSIETVEFDGPATLLCDKCGKFVEFSSFKKARAFKKKQKEKQGGWRSAKVDDQWKDFCGNCVSEFAKGGG